MLFKIQKNAEVSDNNPFMNPLPFDNRKRAGACNVLNKIIN